VAYQAETQFPRRKRLILLCCEDLRPVACALESALRSRGWEVDVEFGANARPWVQKLPPVTPSVRVLCVPGTVDRVLAQQLRTAFRPEPEADLHILGVDDSPGLVHEIERLAGVRTPSRRPLSAQPRLAHATMIETQVRRERTWRVGAVSALAAFVITLGGMSMVDHSARAPELSSASFAGGLTSLATPRPADLDTDHSRPHDPVLAAVGPLALDSLDEPLPADDVEIVLLDDEDAFAGELPPEQPRSFRVAAVRITVPKAPDHSESFTSPLAGPAPATDDDVTVTIIDDVTSAGTEPSDAAAPKRQLPQGFLPVAGLAVAPPVTTIDPFEAVDVTITDVVTTIDPFGPSIDAAAP